MVGRIVPSGSRYSNRISGLEAEALACTEMTQACRTNG
jgi:hypothetical protein